MKRSVVIVLLVIIVSMCSAEDLSIYHIQYSTDINGKSPEEGNDVNCIGGIVIDKFGGFKAKLTLYDPNITGLNDINGWRGIFVKTEWGFDNTVFNNINIGNWISLDHVLVVDGESSQGNTLLEYGPSSSFTVESTDNELPEPIVIDVNEITSPVYDNNEPAGWYVSDIRSEKYEAMPVRIDNVKVDANAFGPKGDMYLLQSIDNNNTEYSCWASDYMNDDTTDDYHPFVTIGASFCSVEGIIEQYTKESGGYMYDFYQLLTLDTGSLKRETPADLTGDCMVNMEDMAEFSKYWLWGTE